MSAQLSSGLLKSGASQQARWRVARQVWYVLCTPCSVLHQLMSVLRVRTSAPWPANRTQAACAPAGPALARAAASPHHVSAQPVLRTRQPIPHGGHGTFNIVPSEPISCVSVWSRSRLTSHSHPRSPPTATPTSAGDFFLFSSSCPILLFLLLFIACRTLPTPHRSPGCVSFKPALPSARPTVPCRDPSCALHQSRESRPRDPSLILISTPARALAPSI